MCFSSRSQFLVMQWIDLRSELILLSHGSLDLHFLGSLFRLEILDMCLYIFRDKASVWKIATHREVKKLRKK
jgi:hypothetical protein